MTVKRGDIFYADLSPVIGSEQGGLRPVLIIQNDIGNKYSPTVIVAAITSKLGKSRLPTHIEVYRAEHPVGEYGAGLSRDSVVLLEQIRTLDKQRLKEKIGHLDELLMDRIDDAISISFGLSAREGEPRHAEHRTRSAIAGYGGRHDAADDSIYAAAPTHDDTLI